MLSASKRLKKTDFPHIMKGGRFFSTQNLSLRVFSGYTTRARAAFVVSSRVKRTSVGRHLIKRRLSAAVESLWEDIKSGLGLVITCNKDISKQSSAEIRKEVRDLLTRAGALN